MNLVTQESGPQKGTDSQTGILKGHPERFCVLICACEARGVAGIKKPRSAPRLVYWLALACFRLRLAKYASAASSYSSLVYPF